MSFVEFLGLIISFIALLILSAKQSREKRQRIEHPELYEQQNQKRQQSMRELFRSMNIELEDEKQPRRAQPVDEEDEEDVEPAKPLPMAAGHPVRQPKAPPRMVGGQYALKYNLDRFKQVRPIDQRHLKSAIDQRKIGRQVVSTDMAPDIHMSAYSLTPRVQSFPGRDLLRSLKSPRDMIILHEILSQPGGLWTPTRHYPPKSRSSL